MYTTKSRGPLSVARVIYFLINHSACQSVAVFLTLIFHKVSVVMVARWCNG